MEGSTSADARRPQLGARRSAGRPRTLSVDAIVTAALALLDREGAEALTMRRLGAELGVEAMSIYRHVPSREALLEAIAGRLAARIDTGGEPSDWEEALRALAGGLRAVGRRHPAAFQLVGMRVLGAPHALATVEKVLASLRNGGITPARAIAAYRLVLAYTRGYVLSELSGFAVEAGPADGFPALRALGRRLASEPSEVGFRTGLETILGGLRAEQEAAA